MPSLPSVSAPNPQTSSDYSPVGRVEYALLILVLLIFSEGLLPRLLSSEDAVEGSPILRLLWLPIYALAFTGLIWKAREIARVCLRLPFLMALLLVCALSFLWSIDPGLSMRRSLAIVMTTIA